MPIFKPWAPALVTSGPNTLRDGDDQEPFRGGRVGELITSQLRGRYSEQSQRGNIFAAYDGGRAGGIPAFTDANNLNSILWNGTSSVRANVLGAAIFITANAASAGAIAWGITGAKSSTPVNPGAPTSVFNCRVGGPRPACNFYAAAGTPAGSFFFPLGHVHDISQARDNMKQPRLVWIDGLITVMPRTFIAIASSAAGADWTYAALVVWEETPLANA